MDKTIVQECIFMKSKVMGLFCIFVSFSYNLFQHAYVLQVTTDMKDQSCEPYQYLQDGYAN